MNITEKYLHDLRQKYVKQRDAHRSAVDACEGAIQVLDSVAADLAKTEPPAAPKASGENPR
jgi:hypothetical protein